MRTGSDTALMIKPRQTAELQDEVYRQMLRLEAGCSAADLHLALALLRAWTVLELQPPRSSPREWLRSICPVCLRMIASRELRDEHD